MAIIKPNPNHPDLRADEKLNEMKLFVFFKDLKPESLSLLEMSVDELLTLSYESEALAKPMPTNDFAWGYFQREKHMYEKLAVLQDNRQKYIHKL